MLDEFRRQSTASPLRADQLLADLDRDNPELAAALRQALEGDPREFPARRICDVMQSYGHVLSGTAIASWRRRHCG